MLEEEALSEALSGLGGVPPAWLGRCAPDVDTLLEWQLVQLGESNVTRVQKLMQHSNAKYNAMHNSFSFSSI